MPGVILQSWSSYASTWYGFVWVLPRNAVLAHSMLWPCVRPSVGLSVSNWYCTKMAERRIMQTRWHNSLGTVVFWCQRSCWNSNGVSPNRGAKHSWGWLKLQIFDQYTVSCLKEWSVTFIYKIWIWVWLYVHVNGEIVLYVVMCLLQSCVRKSSKSV